MIALNDDLNHSEVGKKKSTIRTKGTMQTLLQRLIRNHKKRKLHRSDRLALNQLLQLDDALLKDIGISRSEVNAMRNGTLSMDALIKRDITTARDNTGHSQPNKGISS